MTMRIEFSGGERIDIACGKLVDTANSRGIAVVGAFNEVDLVATPGASSTALQEFYTSEINRRHDEWSNSAEGQEFESRVSAGKALARAEGVLPFSIRDVDAWNAHVAANDDNLGQILTRFIARWANLMEKDIAVGHSVAGIADRCIRIADLEIMSGYAVSIATRVLCQVWTHGDELRQWAQRHNR